MLAIGGVASAHIDPDPTEAQAGSRLTVGFTVEHGCEGSPTVQLDMRLPAGVTDPATEPAEGWEGSIAAVDGDTIVTFAGGPLADDVEGTFSVTMTLPPTPDTTIYFPFVQRCAVGEIRWIGIPTEPGEELDEPAPAMTLTGPVVTVPTTAPITETTAPEVTVPETTEVPVTTEVPETTEASVAPSTSEPVSVGIDEDGDPRTGTIMFIVSIAVIAGLGAFVVFRSRQARASSSGDHD